MKRVYLILFIFVFVGCFIGCSIGVRKEIKSKRDHINTLINVGMDLDEAMNILEANGYRVGSKHTPTKKRDYISVFIPLVDRIPASVTFSEVVGTDSDLEIYVIIEAGLDNKIKSIE